MDATIIEARSSTKNRAGERDPAMHQTKKGEPVALRDEGSHRGGRRYEHSPQHERDGGQRSRCYAGAQSATRGRDGGVGVMPGIRGCISGGRTWGWRWNGGWRCVRGVAGSWSPGAKRR